MGPYPAGSAVALGGYIKLCKKLQLYPGASWRVPGVMLEKIDSEVYFSSGLRCSD